MIKLITIIFAIPLLWGGCSNSIKETTTNSDINSTTYIKNIEKTNKISYSKIVNSRGTYITSMCYTKTKDKDTNTISNPCYSCHTKGKVPNYYNDTILQKEYSFPPEMIKNPFSNLFKDRSVEVSMIDDETILKYIRESNYFDKNNTIILSSTLPKDWGGYRPDCYYDFDDEGFDHKPNGDYTLWRAFRYYPFLGTFWPTNGSTDDVLIRLDRVFALDIDSRFDIEIYKHNLSVVEALVKQKDTNLSLVGLAREYQKDNKIQIAKGLYPVGTEFLHSVRYIDWDDTKGHIRVSARMKELRYAKKTKWQTYSQIDRTAQNEQKEAIANGLTQGVLATFRGSYEKGLDNQLGWIYQGFIEDKNGRLRPQTHEETIGCMGCHSHLGATTDSIFSFSRKFEGADKNKIDYGWSSWSQKGLIGIKEPKVDYLNIKEKYEYSFYLQNNHSGNEFRDNDEVQSRFFETNGSLKPDMIEGLHNDITTLLFPSKKRALKLNKAYRVIVKNQSFIYGRDATITPMSNIYKEIEDDLSTEVERVIVRK